MCNHKRIWLVEYRNVTTSDEDGSVVVYASTTKAKALRFIRKQKQDTCLYWWAIFSIGLDSDDLETCADNNLSLYNKYCKEIEGVPY